MIESLTLLSPISHFYIPWKWYKTKPFLTFSEGIEMEHLAKVGYSSLPKSLKLSNKNIRTKSNLERLVSTLSPNTR